MKFRRKSFSYRFYIFNVCIFLLFGFTISYAFYIQYYNFAKFSYEANTNTLKHRKLSAPRGAVKDRNGIVLASTKYENDVYVIEHYFKGDFNFVCDTLDIANCGSINNYVKKYSFNRILIAKNISNEQAGMIHFFPGIQVFTYAKRIYDNDFASQHVVGYVNRIDRSILETENDDSLYADDDYSGETGVERMYDRILHGENGQDRYIVRANGLELQSPNKFLRNRFVAPIKGKDLTLSIDKGVQDVIYQGFGEHVGGAVMIDIKTGEVIALVSKPTFDPNDVKQFFFDPSKPLMNRVLKSYAPGSTFKLIAALAALEMHVATPDTKFDCPGTYSFGGRVWHCWKHDGGHGRINMKEAIQQSCDVYFYQLAQKIGIDNLQKYANALGLGRATNIDLDNESVGRIPSMRWYKHSYSGGWNPGALLNTVIGQGVVQVSPIQIAVAYGVLANGGKFHQPHLIKGVDEPLSVDYNFDENNLKFLRLALYSVINEENGTAYSARVPDGVIVAGKTGTAQVVGGIGKQKINDHAWFVGYAPADNPKVVISVFVENGGHGASAAAPIAMKAINAYLGKQK